MHTPFRESTPEQAVNGVWGWVDDDLAFLRPWGFDVRDISVPILIEYGETDVLVPHMERGLPQTSPDPWSRSSSGIAVARVASPLVVYEPVEVVFRGCRGARAVGERGSDSRGSG